MPQTREVLEVDVLIVGAGPAGLAAAYRLTQLPGAADLKIAVLEKGREIGSHTISGAVLDPRSLFELMPDAIERGAPLDHAVRYEEVCFLTSRRHFRLPIVPPPLRNDGCFVISLNRFVRWLGDIVETSGVDLFPGFSGAELLLDGDRVVGVRTGDRGLDREGRPKAGYEPGVDIRARLTILAEGVRGSLTKDLIGRLKLDEGRNPQTYSVGVKEVWEVSRPVEPGYVLHTMGYPLSSREFGGGFLYTMAQGRVSVGLVVGLDYRDPTLDPHERFQAWKMHPRVRQVVEGGRVLSYGAKAIPEGGYWSIPQCSVDGGLIVGDAGGFLNSMRLKGIHLAIKTGMLAAESAMGMLSPEDTISSGFEAAIDRSWVREELWGVRNFHQGFRGGLWAGMAHAALQMVSGGRGLQSRYPSEPGHSRMQRSTGSAENTRDRVIFDRKLTFDRPTDVYLSGTRHEEDQPVHLVVTAPETCHPRCTVEYGNPCQYFCPAAVYEMAPSHAEDVRLQINASNCVHCKTCDIMDPYQIIEWKTPEGGDGPDYKYL